MRPLLILVLCCIALSQAQKQATPDKRSAQEPIQKAAPNQSSPDTRQSSATPADNHKARERTEPVKEINDALLAIFTGALVVVGYLQWKTLRDHEKWMQKHDAKLEALADAAKKNADAASLNAQAVINSERPWLIVVIQQKAGHLMFKASNEGRSPAIVLARFAQFSIQSDLRMLSVPPFYGSPLPIDVPLLTPNAGHDQLGPFFDLYDYPFDETMHLDPELLAAIQKEKQHLVFWFKIVYTTQLAIDGKLAPHETRYCCEYSPSMTAEVKAVGPAEYNKFT
jgi:hypothetical protein